MHILMPVASLVMLALAVATVLLLRSFFGGSSRHNEVSITDLCWRDYRPFDRLLDPADFEFLRSRGVSEVRVRKLRA